MAEKDNVAALRTKKVALLSPKLQLYAQKSVGELTEKLLDLFERSKGERLSNELCEVLYVLKAQKLRSISHAHLFRTRGGLRALLQLLSHCKECEARDLVLLLGTLGNLCALEHETRCAVMKDALSDVAFVMKNSVRSDILSTSSRVLANLALDESNIGALLEEGVSTKLTRMLMGKGVDEGCKQSILRTIRLFGADSDYREELKSTDGLVPIIDCLKSDNKDVSLAALRTLETLSLDSDSDFIQPLCSNGAIPYIVKYCTCSEAKVVASAVTALLNCAKNSDGRVALGSAGGIEALVSHLSSCDLSSAVFQEVTRALCSCCRDVLSRQRLRDCGGLGKLIEMLSKISTASLHGDILSALICYYFDENTLKFMVKRLGLLKALTYHLQEMSKRVLNSTDEGGTEAESEIAEEEEEETAMTMETSTQENRSGECTSEFSCEECHGCSPSVASTDCSSLASEDTVQTQSSDTCSSTAGEGGKEDDQLSTVVGGAEEKVCVPSVPASADPLKDCQTSVADPNGTPPVPKRPRLQLDIEASTPMPANFIDSLLSSPNPYQRQNKMESPLTADFGMSVDSQVVLLLSRVSHLRDCLTSLAVPDVLLAILNYFASQKPPNSHVFKVLTRVVTNPHCFQDCLTSLVPSRIYEHLSLPADVPCTPTEPCLGGLVSPLDIPSPLSSHLLPPSPQHRQQSFLSPLYCGSPLLFSDGCLVFHSMCRELLERLAKVAESPYGQGVLAHMLLRGEMREKHASCLALPLLCRSLRICQRMMLGYKGLQLLSDLAVEASVTQAKAVHSLLALAQNIQKLSQKRRFSVSDEETTTPLCKKPRWSSPCSSTEEEISPHDLYNPEASHKVFCRYHDSDHCPFDLTMVVSGDGQPGATAQFSVHRSILMESSNVFRVMLSGHYWEAHCNKVCVQEVSPLAFTSLLHYIYGCGWLCPVVMEKVQQYTQERDLLTGDKTTTSKSSSDTSLNCEGQLTTVYTATAAMIEDVCCCTGDHEMAAHCLQVLACAGRFLLPTLMAQCEHHFAASLLSPSNVVPVFHFARLHQCYCLAESCLHCVIAMPHSELRSEVFADLLACSEGTSVLEMIETLLTSALVT